MGGILDNTWVRPPVGNHQKMPNSFLIHVELYTTVFVQNCRVKLHDGFEQKASSKV